MKKIVFILLVCLLLTNISFAVSDYDYSRGLYSNNLLTTQQYDTAFAYYKSHFSAEQIRTLVNKLNDLKYKCSTTESTVNYEIVDAVYTYQKDHKLSADGIAGPTTLKQLGIASTAAKPTNNSSTVKVKLVDSYMEYNNHVGNEWGTSVKVNDKELSYDEEMTVSITSSGSLKLSVFATEFDSIPDNGSGSKTVKLKDLKRGVNTITISAIVTENRGRYSGNTAKWTFVFEITK